MIVDINKKYIVDGLPVRILCTNANNDKNPVIVLNQHGRASNYSITGKHQHYKQLNLVELPGTMNEEIERIFNSARNSGLTSDEALNCLLAQGVTMHEFTRWIKVKQARS
jgi:hypothetical protein